ncbi:M-phase phosphoprotein 6 [Trichinella pseudospiralis]|uniref:M-phase phosphoprotein 6 n=1 Tax=Trichinella pseudospiralis TaxID=6337 RepID=A0A0V1IT73_TRIPS|nr:M-phase phosphoprotein 6 [Trichinella pseudospiralis]KRZ25862.1 M-phase phosphoprotein 6 [Trichinella pseudospiralis]
MFLVVKKSQLRTQHLYKMSLSNICLSLKFMRPTKLRLERERGELDNKTEICVTRQSFTEIEDLSRSRFSFQSFNPKVKKYDSDENCQKVQLEAPDEVDVTWQEAANYLSSAKHTINRKFTTKKEREKELNHQETKKEGFIRPKF